MRRLRGEIGSVAGTLVVAAIAVVLWACAAAPDHTSGPPVPREIEADRFGVELRRWLIDEGRSDIGAALDALGAEPVGAFEDGAAWRESGLRAVRLPVDRVEALRGTLKLLAPDVRLRLDSAERWSELVGSAALGPTPGAAGLLWVRVEGAEVPVAAWRLRLLGRAWVAPRVRSAADGRSPEVEPVLRIEMVPQAVDAPRASRVADQGVVMERLRLRFEHEEGYAYVVLPEAPEIEWSALSDAPPAAPLGGPAELVPPVFTPQTLGEAMLTGVRAGRDGEVMTTRSVLVITPRAGERFRLSP